ncbi:MAG: flagellar basal body-associated FliL family protein [Thermodesulfobacteriota bacterium]|nr:flagellar basal body-associated FliL family protein [Thermodesulfobacteriota bacterium]
MVAGIILVVLSASGLVWHFFLKGHEENHSDRASSADIASSDEEIGQKREGLAADIIKLDPFNNIKLQPGGNMDQLDLEIALELADPGMRKSVETIVFKIREVVERESAKKSWMELRTPAGKLSLKYTLLDRINGVLSEAKINNVYFTHLIMK